MNRLLLASQQSRSRLIAQISAIIGSSGRALYIADPNEGKVVPDLIDPTIFWTHSVAPDSSRYTRAGMGELLSLDGATQYLTAPDTSKVSFGNGTNDSPFSVFAVLRRNAGGTVASKDDNGLNSEWRVQAGAGGVSLILFSGGVATTNVVGLGTPALANNVLSDIGLSYDGTGGATAANGILAYANGLALSMTPTNNPSYVAMSDKTALPTIGMYGAPTAFYTGDLGLFLIAAGKFSPGQFIGLHAVSQVHYRI